MSYSLGEQRKKTMIERLGNAVELIDDQRFLPFYRSIQIRLEKDGNLAEWDKMITLSKTKENASRYFASLCKAIKNGTYKFVEAVKEVASEVSLYISDKLIKFNFGKYHKYWARKAKEFINKNGEVGFVELLEYAERKNINQKQMATALKNCKTPQSYYKENILGAAK